MSEPLGMIGSMTPGRAYWVTYESRDIGYGVEADYAEFVFRGPEPGGGCGKYTFTPVGGGPDLYLFPDEIKDAYDA